VFDDLKIKINVGQKLANLKVEEIDEITKEAI
jgi:hypothetical protein